MVFCAIKGNQLPLNAIINQNIDFFKKKKKFVREKYHKTYQKNFGAHITNILACGDENICWGSHNGFGIPLFNYYNSPCKFFSKFLGWNLGVARFQHFDQMFEQKTERTYTLFKKIVPLWTFLSFTFLIDFEMNVEYVLVHITTIHILHR